MVDWLFGFDFDSTRLCWAWRFGNSVAASCVFSWVGDRFFRFNYRRLISPILVGKISPEMDIIKKNIKFGVFSKSENISRSGKVKRNKNFTAEKGNNEREITGRL